MAQVTYTFCANNEGLVYSWLRTAYSGTDVYRIDSSGAVNYRTCYGLADSIRPCFSLNRKDTIYTKQ